MKSEGRRTNLLKPIVTKNSMNPLAKASCLNEFSVDSHKQRGDENYFNSSGSTQISGSSRMQSENRVRPSRQHRDSFKASQIK
mmetsp:Transcript_36518/g.42030  ORF Transcript_36518/g.42030 Transcript_36518/m.42030 type:complete len:83 (+) Transcript_36518:846-1094(+)